MRDIITILKYLIGCREERGNRNILGDKREPTLKLQEIVIYRRVCIYFQKNPFYIFLFFERQSTSGGGAEREGNTESETDSTEPNVGLELTNHKIMT